MPNCILIQLLKPLLCRDDQIRTGDPFVPNEVRYQLRYIPNSSFLATAKVQFFSFSDHNLIEIFHIMDKITKKAIRRLLSAALRMAFVILLRLYAVFLIEYFAYS